MRGISSLKRLVVTNTTYQNTSTGHVFSEHSCIPYRSNLLVVPPRGIGKGWINRRPRRSQGSQKNPCQHEFQSLVPCVRWTRVPLGRPRINEIDKWYLLTPVRWKPRARNLDLIPSSPDVVNIDPSLRSKRGTSDILPSRVPSATIGTNSVFWWVVVSYPLSPFICLVQDFTRVDTLDKRLVKTSFSRRPALTYLLWLVDRTDCRNFHPLLRRSTATVSMCLHSPVLRDGVYVSR